jgi:Flp pilus assembly protein TadD
MDDPAASATLELAETHFAAGRLAEAEKLFRRVLDEGVDGGRVLHFLGYIARQNGDLEAAADSYVTAVALDGANGQLHSNLAEVQRALGQLEAAVGSYRRAAALAPDEAVIHYNLGTLVHQLHREDDAVDSLLRAVAIRPETIEITRSIVVTSAAVSAKSTSMRLWSRTDTAAAHLAGALGKSTWLMLPLGPDYRWMLGRDDCPWYPIMRLFRQPALHAWEPVVGTIMQCLDAGR